MEIITETDVVRLANALSVKSGLNMSILSISQCTCDFVLALYLSIMGELPSGVVTESTSVLSQEHNIECLINALAVEYLQVDLSHILPVCFVAGEPTTIYNFLEILDGLLAFMLEQIDLNLDSGDEGDVESDISTIPLESEKDFHVDNSESDISAFTNGLINLELHSYDLPAHDATYSKPSEESEESRHKLPEFPIELKRDETDNIRTLCEKLESSSDVITEKTPEPRFPKELKLHEKLSSPRPMLIKSLRNANEEDGTRIIEDLKKSLPLRSPMQTNRIWEKQDPEVVLDTSLKGSGLVLSDFTSESSTQSEFEHQSKHAIHEQRLKVPGDGLLDGIDVADGIPKPDFSHGDQTFSTDETQAKSKLLHSDEKDWQGLLTNLQKTVEESKRIREKYFATPLPPKLRSVTSSDEETKEDSTFSKDESAQLKRQRNVRFEDTVSTATAKKLEDFKSVLQKENRLQSLKNKILSENYRDHLEEVEDAERRKMKPLVARTRESEKQLHSAMSKSRKKKTPRKKDLVAAAKWRSWQSPTVVKTSWARSGRVKRSGEDRLVIGEHDLLPTLISEFPGLELSSAALNNAWKKQFRHIEALTKHESNHAMKKRLSEKRLEESRSRHELLIEVMRKEHEHNQRVRDGKMRAAGKQEAARKVKDRRQQSARVRRYYRDYQLQMRARMLKRRTREEKLFKNLFEEGLKIQRSRLNDLRHYARDRRVEQQVRQRNEIASLENYYKDQFAMLAETLENEKKDLKTKNVAQNKLLRQMGRGLRQKMEKEICNLQEQISRDDDDIYFREVEADRVRRQLQMATYNAKFNTSIANKY